LVSRPWMSHVLLSIIPPANDFEESMIGRV
jgi:hypothetical protein